MILIFPLLILDKLYICVLDFSNISFVKDVIVSQANIYGHGNETKKVARKLINQRFLEIKINKITNNIANKKKRTALFINSNNTYKMVFLWDTKS